jgi:sugar phosphate permease
MDKIKEKLRRVGETKLGFAIVTLTAGMLAGILNGCCYVGSTASAYGLGLVAERAGWLAVFWVLLGACALTLLLSVVYLLLRRRA